MSTHWWVPDRLADGLVPASMISFAHQPSSRQALTQCKSSFHQSAHQPTRHCARNMCCPWKMPAQVHVQFGQFTLHVLQRIGMTVSVWNAMRDCHSAWSAVDSEAVCTGAFGCSSNLPSLHFLRGEYTTRKTTNKR